MQSPKMSDCLFKLASKFWQNFHWLMLQENWYKIYFNKKQGNCFKNYNIYINLQYFLLQVFFPEKYAPGNADFDFSLLRLDRPMPIGRNIAVLNLPAKEYLVQTDDLLIVTGWGSTHVRCYYIRILFLIYSVWAVTHIRISYSL